MKNRFDETIHFTLAPCSLGFVLVAASKKGVCAIFLSENSSSLRKDLQRCFPNSRLVENPRAFEKWIHPIVEFVESPTPALNLPLDIRGTAFQQRVWKALCQIPLGSTTSYSQIARKLGSPKAARAVASACASNKIAMAIPCHRVRHADGSLAGYRWEIKRKQALLDRETAARKAEGCF